MTPIVIFISIRLVQLVIPLQSAMQYENYRCAQVLVEEAGGVVSMKGWVGLLVGRRGRTRQAGL